MEKNYKKEPGVGIKVGALKSGCDCKLCILVVGGIFLSMCFQSSIFYKTATFNFKRKMFLMPKYICHSSFKTGYLKNGINIGESTWTAGLLDPAFVNLKQGTKWESEQEMWYSS